ncbi:MAG: S41 family peptidase [Myxococcota bacterium]
MIRPLITHPAVRGERIVFVSEDDLWSVDLDGGLARRLTSGTSRMRTPRISRDGRQIAVSAAEEGAREVYVLDADGGPLTRRTWVGANLSVVGYDPAGAIVFGSSHEQPFSKHEVLYSLDPGRGSPVPLGLGPAVALDWAADGRRVLCRHSVDLAHWQRYRGGRMGQLWIEQPDGTFVRLVHDGNVASPLWVGDRLFFLSDRSGHGNLVSCLPDGTDLQKHSKHKGFPARLATHDGASIVYVVAGDLWRFDVASGKARMLKVQTRSQRTRTQVRYPSAKSHLQAYALHPQGHSFAVVSRGKPFVGGHWEGPLLQRGTQEGVHHRLATFLADGERMVWASDDGGEDHLAVHDLVSGATHPIDADLGRVRAIAEGPGDVVAVTNHRSELFVVAVKAGEVTLVEKNANGPITGPTWSADGRWLAWASGLEGFGRSRIRLAHVHGVQVQSVTDVTDGRFRDHAPDFDPLGRFLYFVSDRELDPIDDGVRFQYGFPRGSRPYLVTLSADTPNPFRQTPRDLGKPKPIKAPEQLEVDLDGLQHRIVRFPISDGRYRQIVGLPSGRVLVSRVPLVSATRRSWNSGGPPDADGSLLLWDFATYELSTVHTRITGFTVDHPRKTCMIRAGNDLRVFPADPDKSTRTELKTAEPRSTTRKERWIDLSRARLAISPPAEWAQMLDESWRLMRDHFWDPGMSGVDWAAVRARYRELVPRVSVRSELSDLIWCMVGELGTSHAYEMGGDYRGSTVRTIGRLGAEVAWDGQAWAVTALHPGDLGHPSRSAPLLAPGVRASVGTRIHAVNGLPVREDPPLGALLVGHANRPVVLELSEADGPHRHVEVVPLNDDSTARYRTWVAANRARVHEATGGRAGYVHVPDMGPAGFAEFYRDFLSESDHDALVVDVRWNRGGHVSQLLLGQLMQRRLAYSRSRHFKVYSYPAHAVLGPMIALTNEMAGSDGDIFSHHWKGLGLGPLVGTRTWGGVVGISPRNRLVDGTIVTQPEFANWMDGGVGFGVENHGVDPDVVVEITPNDHLAGRDPQLDRALELLLERIAAEDPKPPDLGPAPTTTHVPSRRALRTPRKKR